MSDLPFALGCPGVGYTVEDRLNETLEIARTAGRPGCNRFWMSERHTMPALAIASLTVMIARLSAETERIRLGAGGIMLPNHSPLVIAEEYGMLDALAPGTDAMRAAALRRGVDVNEGFPRQLSELMGFLGDNFPAGRPYKDVHAVSGPWQAKQDRVAVPETTPELWILSSSTYSAHLAAPMGRSYAFALQFGNADLS